jgi:hypothetical protein
VLGQIEILRTLMVTGRIAALGSYFSVFAGAGLQKIQFFLQTRPKPLKKLIGDAARFTACGPVFRQIQQLGKLLLCH